MSDDKCEHGNDPATCGICRWDRERDKRNEEIERHDREGRLR